MKPAQKYHPGHSELVGRIGVAGIRQLLRSRSTRARTAILTIVCILTAQIAAAGAVGPDPSRRLASEKSLYLVTHAKNPVDWYPWGEAAFAKARREQKPIFLSIGYAACHWCHVMERESFESSGIAETLNAQFVSILVDREERPEVDAAYIPFLEAMTGSAGWPANFILTPDLEPIVGVSYLSSEALDRLLSTIAGRWAANRDALLASSEQIVSMVRPALEERSGEESALSMNLLDSAARQIVGSYDAEQGGFGPAPRFPKTSTIDFLLRYAERTGNPQARQAALGTLRAIASGGIRDQLGGGFHRYAVDGAWRVPHFEKMLYDQALLSIVYVEGWQMTGEAAYADVARSSLDYVLGELRQPGGAFASAHDSDSRRSSDSAATEGAYYLWTMEELESILARPEMDVVAAHYGVKRAGNIAPEFDPTGELKGKNVLAVAQPMPATAAQLEITEAAAAERLATARSKMMERRRRRPSPRQDDKVIAGWNGLMISALARAGAAFDERRYLVAATDAARFIRSSLYDRKVRRLKRSYREGKSGVPALSEDYAYLIAGMTDLYESTFELEWLQLAVALQQRHDDDFWDAASGRYRVGGEVPASLAGIISANDAPLPNHNSVAAMNLLRLAEFTDNSHRWQERAATLLRSFALSMSERPDELPQLLSALNRNLATSKQIIIAGDPDAADTKALLRIVNSRFLPNRTLLLAPGGRSQAALAEYLPLVKQMRPIANRATAYICEHYVCKLPTSDPRQVETLLDH